MYPGDGPGLGVDLDEKLAAKYPYQRAYLARESQTRRHVDRLVGPWRIQPWTIGNNSR